MKTLTGAVVGLGIGARHAQVLSSMEGVGLGGVADLDAERAASVARRCQTRAYGDCVEMLDAQRPDFICVCTPPSSHLFITREAARRGVHVFCEKPMASRVADCDEMIEACRNSRVLLMIGQKKRLSPAFQFARERLHAQFGTPRWAAVRYALGRVEKAWFWEENDGGGPLLENSIHAVDTLRFLLGEVERVYAEADNLFNKQYAPQLDTAAVSLRFRSGAIASLGCGQAYEWDFASEGTYLACDNAVVEITGPFDNPDTVRYILRSEPGKVKEVRFPPYDLFQIELGHFADCIRTGAAPLVSGEDGRASVAVCLALKRSARSGMPVTLSSITG